MKYRLIFAPKFTSQLKKFDSNDQKVVLKKLKELEKNPFKGKPLRDVLKGYKSLRVRHLSVVYSISEENLQIKILRIDHRKKIY